MKVGFSLLTQRLDRLGGLSLRLGALIRSLAEQGHEVVALQTTEARHGSQDFYYSVNRLPVSWVAVDFRLSRGTLRSIRPPASAFATHWPASKGS